MKQSEQAIHKHVGKLTSAIPYRIMVPCHYHHRYSHGCLMCFTRSVVEVEGGLAVNKACCGP